MVKNKSVHPKPTEHTVAASGLTDGSVLLLADNSLGALEADEVLRLCVSRATVG